jgi:hypothetical protein
MPLNFLRRVKLYFHVGNLDFLGISPPVLYVTGLYPHMRKEPVSLTDEVVKPTKTMLKSSKAHMAITRHSAQAAVMGSDLIGR